MYYNFTKIIIWTWFKSCWYFHYWFRTLKSNYKWTFNCALHSPEQRERLFVTSFITLCKPDVNSIQKQCFWPNIPSFTLQTLGKKGVFMLVLNLNTWLCKQWLEFWMIFYNNSFDHIVLYWFFCKFYIFNESHWILSSVIFLSKKWRGNMYFATLCAYSEISFDFKLSGTGIFSVWHIHFLVCRFRLTKSVHTADLTVS